METFKKTYKVLYKSKDKILSSGKIPEDDEDWLCLENEGISVVVNFSLQTISGKRAFFEIINIPSHIESLCMPMTQAETQLVEDFLNVIDQIAAYKKLYVCGTPDAVYSLSTIIANKKGINLTFENYCSSDVYMYTNFVQKYTTI